MPNPINQTNITPPRVPLTDERTGLISREWYRFLLNLFKLTGSGTNDTSLVDLQLGPPDSRNAAIAPSDFDLKPRDELGTLAAQNADNVRLIGFSTSPSPAIPNPAPTGTVYWDGGTTLGVQMTQNVVQKVGEDQFFYIKASSAISRGQLIMFTGAVGASGLLSGAPATGLTDGQYLMGVAAEDIANNGFGLVSSFGLVRGFDASGTPYGEVWADGDILYYNPAFAGGFTKTIPSAPNVKATVAVVVHNGSGGSGSVFVRISVGSVLGGTDSNVQFGTLANKDLIQYDSVAGYWKNVAPSTISIGTATNLAGGAAGSVPYQTGAGATSMLALGTAAQVLQVNAGATAPEWVSSTGTGNVARATSPTFVTKVIINGSLGRNAPVTKTASFTLADTENWLICNGTATITVTFPAASSWTGREVMIKTTAAFTVVSASSNVVPLAGGAAGTAILAATAGKYATLVSNGTNWIIMAAN